MDRTCSIEDCERAFYGRGWCNMHYQRWKAHGDPTKVTGLKGRSLVERFWAQVDRGEPDECWETKGHRSPQGYGSITYQGKAHALHRVSYFLHTGVWPELDVLHSCDNPPCVNPAHLRQGTHSDNMRDMLARERREMPRGEAHHQAKLTEDDVRELRLLRDQGWLLKQLSGKYGIHVGTVSSIVNRKIWTHI